MGDVSEAAHAAGCAFFSRVMLVQTYEEMVGADGALHTQREQFVKFWTLVKRAHPVQACRSGTRSMLAKLDV